MSTNNTDELKSLVYRGLVEREGQPNSIEKTQSLWEKAESLINEQMRLAKIEAFKHGLITGAMPEALGKPIAKDYLAELHKGGDSK